MASGSISRRLAVCLLNISEGRRRDIVERIAKAAIYGKNVVKVELREKRFSKTMNPEKIARHIMDDQKYLQATVLNIFSDYDYNRSVITIAAPINRLGSCVVAACVEAFSRIDMAAHVGIHPCLGAVDLVPIYPLSGVSVEDCGTVARSIAETLACSVPECSIFLFGEADRSEKRSLVQRRKQVGWFNRRTSDPASIVPDVGSAPTLRYGLTGVGASPYVMNCNVTVDTQDLTTAKEIAKSIRGSSVGGLEGVQSMAFPHNGKIEIACNVESMENPGHFLPSYEELPYVSYSILGKTYYYVSPQMIETLVEKLARDRGITTVGTALVGFTPEECLNHAAYALANGVGDFWRKRGGIFM